MDTIRKQKGFVDDYLAYLLARASHLISSQFHQVVQAQGLSLMEWRVMASLSGKTGLSIGALANIVLAKQPTVTKLIDRMAGSGWVERLDDRQDKRQRLVRLTVAGRRKVRPLLIKAKQHEEQVLSRVGPASSHRLKKALEHLIEGQAQAADTKPGRGAAKSAATSPP